MPPRKRHESNAMLYTLIAFVGLFIAGATVAIIYYVKAEDFKTKEAALRTKIADLANAREEQSLGAIVGTRERPKTWLGTMVENFDAAMAMVTGTAPQPTHAQAKLATARAEVDKALALAQEYVDLTGADPNSIGLTRVIADMKVALDNATAAGLAVRDQLVQLQARYDDAMAAMHEEREILLAEKGRLQQEINETTADYNTLRAMLEQTTDQRVQNILAQLDQEKAERNQLNQDLVTTQAQLDLTSQKMRRAQDEVALTKAPPDSNLPALVVDAQVIMVDLYAKTVHINKGSNDRIYRGLTFAIHDKNAPLPKDGKGKAEIEVYDVQKTFSAARIVNANPKRPILEGDVVSNLIWDSARKNVFVVAGEFDLDKKGGLDYDARTKLKALIEKWGGRVDDAVSVDTDFLVIGRRPPVLTKPTFEELEIEPQAMDKYEESLRRRGTYDNIRAQAEALWVPIFSYDRFLHFIGYKQQSANAGAF